MREKPREIDLEASAFRPVVKKPLADPKMLRTGLWVSGGGIVLCAFGASQLGGFWAAFLPAFPAVLFGVAWVSLSPGFWHRE